jgi:hypothetical protein
MQKSSGARLIAWAIRLRGFGLVVAVGAWLALVGLGMKWILDYQTAPGEPANAPALWPDSTRVPRRPGEPSLVVFMHPHCPCTRATLGELGRILAHTPGGLRASAVFVVPPGLDPEWAKTDLWRSASHMARVDVILDRDGKEALRFGAKTSGQALLYDATGHLKFAGGITPGRGHEGDNAGSDAVVAFVEHSITERPDTPVLGCTLTARPAGAGGPPRSCKP